MGRLLAEWKCPTWWRVAGSGPLYNVCGARRWKGGLVDARACVRDERARHPAKGWKGFELSQPDGRITPRCARCLPDSGRGPANAHAAASPGSPGLEPADEPTEP